MLFIILWLIYKLCPLFFKWTYLEIVIAQDEITRAFKPWWMKAHYLIAWCKCLCGIFPMQFLTSIPEQTCVFFSSILKFHIPLYLFYRQQSAVYFSPGKLNLLLLSIPTSLKNVAYIGIRAVIYIYWDNRNACQKKTHMKWNAEKLFPSSSNSQWS